MGTFSKAAKFGRLDIFETYSPWFGSSFSASVGGSIGGL